MYEAVRWKLWETPKKKKKKEKAIFSEIMWETRIKQLTDKTDNSGS